MTLDAGEQNQPIDRYLLVVLAIGIIALWLWPLRSSFWLDETVTAWIVQGSFSQMIHRSLNFQAISPLYYVIAWGVRQIGGSSEVALRVPSVLAGGATMYLVYRLGKRLVDRTAGLIAAVVFATSFGGAYAATDARPYALGLLVVTGLTVALVRWLDSGARRWALAVIALAALVPYVHYLFAAALPAQAIYAVMRVRKESRVRPLALLIVVLCATALTLPLLPHVLSAANRRGVLSQAAGNVGQVFFFLVPPVLVGGYLLGLAVAAIQQRVTVAWSRIEASELTLLILWAAFPPVILAIASRAIGAGIFASRYLLSGLPAQSLLIAVGIRALTPNGVRRVVVVVMVIVSLLSIGTLQHLNDGRDLEQWRQAVARVDVLAGPETPILAQSGLIESQSVALIRNANWGQYLLAPVEVYPTDHPAIPLPYGTSQPEVRYLDDLVRNLTSADDFVVIARPDLPVATWIEGRATASGFSVQSIRFFGSVEVVEMSHTRAGE